MLSGEDFSRHFSRGKSVKIPDSPRTSPPHLRNINSKGTLKSALKGRTSTLRRNEVNSNVDDQEKESLASGRVNSMFSRAEGPDSVAAQFRVHEAKFKRANFMKHKTEEMML